MADFTSLRRGSTRIRHGWFRLSDRFGPWLYAALTFVAGVLAFWFVVAVLHVGGADDVAPWLVSIFSASAVVFVERRAARQNGLLIEITLAYILDGDRELLDTLLGRFISGDFSPSEYQIGNRLFDTLLSLCDDGDFEMRRRISEALPALGVINAERAVELMQRLRDDYDEERWKADLRRRAIEALSIQVGRHAPLLSRVPRQTVEELVRLKERDGVLTSMAALEVACELPNSKSKTDPHITSVLDGEFDRGYASRPEREALHRLGEFLATTRRSRSRGLSLAREMASSDNLYVQVAAARNAWRLAGDGLAFLEMAELFSAADRHKYVRRPVARENSVRELVGLVKRNNEVGSRAWAVIARLLSDPDEIIADTAFDMVENWKDQARVCEACRIVAEREGPIELLDRARRVAARLSC